MSMISAPNQVGSGVRPLAASERDAALRRVSRVRRWIFGGATALSAAIAALVSSVAPGHTLHGKSESAQPGATDAGGSGSAATQPRTQRTAAHFPALASPADLGLQAPSGAPQPAPSASQSSSAPAPAQAAPVPQPAPVPAPAPAVSGGS